MKSAAFVLGTLLALSVPVAAEAGSGYRHGGGHRGHHHGYRHGYGRVYIAPYYAPYYAYPRYYYPAPAYYAPAPAAVYVEQPPAPIAAPPAQGDWYYCASARGYYPDVQTCAESWQRVAPRP